MFCSSYCFFVAAIVIVLVINFLPYNVVFNFLIITPLGWPVVVLDSGYVEIKFVYCMSNNMLSRNISLLRINFMKTSGNSIILKSYLHTFRRVIIENLEKAGKPSQEVLLEY